MPDINSLDARYAEEDATDDQAPVTDPTIVPFEGFADTGVGSRDLTDVESDADDA